MITQIESLITFSTLTKKSNKIHICNSYRKEQLLKCVGIRIFHNHSRVILQPQNYYQHVSTVLQSTLSFNPCPQQCNTSQNYSRYGNQVYSRMKQNKQIFKYQHLSILSELKSNFTDYQPTAHNRTIQIKTRLVLPHKI